ncbi:MAG: Mpo1-like protein [Gammaproteobacteria bacterium]
MATQAFQLLAEYSADHQDPFNRLMHSICVPLIFLSLLGLLWAIPVPDVFATQAPWLNFGTAALAGVVIYYLRLAPRLGTGMLLASILIVPLIAYVATLPVPLWVTALGVFVVGWIGQFVGHHVEGRRPSFFRDLRFLLIGPLWVLAKLYAAIGLRP